MTTKKSFLKKALVAAVASALVLPAFSGASPVSAAVKKITKPWSTTFLVGGTAPVQGVSVSGWKNDSVLVSVGAVATGSATANAYLRYNNKISVLEQYGLKWGYKSDIDTQKASNNGAGLDTLQFYGPEPLVNAVLANLEVTTTAGTTGVEIKAMATDYKEGLIYFPKVEHFYKFVKPLKADGTLNDKFKWSEAKAAAESSKELGLTGYLATIASAAENDFVTTRISPDGTNAARNVWLGATVADTNYEWKWSGGPEKDVSFYKGCESSASTRTGTSATYHAFSAGEPNNYFSSTDKCSTTTITEGCLLTNNRESVLLGEWNDFPCDLAGSYPKSEGYVIEYGNKAVGGGFVGVYTASAKLIRPVPPAKPTLVETLARKIGSFKNVFAKSGKKLRGTSTVKLKILEKGNYRIFASALLVEGTGRTKKTSRLGLNLRAGSTVNGVEIKDHGFTLKKNSRTVQIKFNIRSGKISSKQISINLYKEVKNADGTITFIRQDIPSNWKIALK